MVLSHRPSPPGDFFAVELRRNRSHAVYDRVDLGAVQTVCAQPVGRFHSAQPSYSGGPDGVPLGPCVEDFSAADVIRRQP